VGILNLVARRLLSREIEPKVAYAIGHIVELALKVNEMVKAHPLHQDEIQHFPGNIWDLVQVPENELAQTLDRYTVDALIELLKRVDCLEVCEAQDKGCEAEGSPEHEVGSENGTANENISKTSVESLRKMVIYFIDLKTGGRNGAHQQAELSGREKSRSPAPDDLPEDQGSNP
jgi:hypothetical protein